MKILLGLAEYPPYNIGGGGVVFANLVREYRRQGHEVVVIYGYYPTKSWVEPITVAAESGTVFYRIPEIPYPKQFPFMKTVMPPNPVVWRKIDKIIREQRVDIAHLHGYGHLIIDKIARVCRAQNVPYLFTNHGFPKIPEEKGGLIKLLWNIYERRIGYFLPKNAGIITCVSKYTASEYGPDVKVEVVPNGIYLSYRPAGKTAIELLKKRYGLTSGDVVYVSVGRITRYKGFQDVVKALPKLPRAKYAIVGPDQDYQHELTTYAQSLGVGNRVIFTGRVEPKHLNNYYQLADVVVIPSHVESFGLVGLEALMNKRPVVFSGAQGLVYLRGSKNTFEYHSESELISLLGRNLTYIDEDFLSKFAWPRVAGRYIDLMRRILNGET